MKLNLVTLCEKNWNWEEMISAPEVAWSLLTGRMWSHEPCLQQGQSSLHRQASGSPWSRKVKIVNQLCLLIKSSSYHINNLSLWESLTKIFLNQRRHIFWSSLSHHRRTQVPEPFIVLEINLSVEDQVLPLRRPAQLQISSAILSATTSRS